MTFSSDVSTPINILIEHLLEMNNCITDALNNWDVPI